MLKTELLLSFIMQIVVSNFFPRLNTILCQTIVICNYGLFEVYYIILVQFLTY
ncbi:hypothetical protein KSS87_017112, partial [Heliosperma pusillum]